MGFLLFLNKNFFKTQRSGLNFVEENTDNTPLPDYVIQAGI
jgi:hypothetical protein